VRRPGQRRAARRIGDAGFPRDKRIEEFDFAANSSVNPAAIHQLATCAWVKAGHPLCLIGDSGTGAKLLFQVLTEREERSAIAIASNEPFSGWTKTFTDPRLCAAIVDRLTFAGQIIETGTTSYRLAHARQRRADGQDRK
jgi:DNA replication protein DnaC